MTMLFLRLQPFVLEVATFLLRRLQPYCIKVKKSVSQLSVRIAIYFWVGAFLLSTEVICSVLPNKGSIYFRFIL